MNTKTLKSNIIDTLLDAIDSNDQTVSVAFFSALLDTVLEDYPTTKPLEWRMMQSQIGEQAITSFGSYCIARTLKGIEISNTFPGYRTAPKQYAQTVEEAKDICKKDLNRRISELLG